MRKVKLFCPYCGSDDIVRDGPHCWNVDKQEWVSYGTYDDMTCEDCGEEFGEAGEEEVSTTTEESGV